MDAGLGGMREAGGPGRSCGARLGRAGRRCGLAWAFWQEGAKQQRVLSPRQPGAGGEGVVRSQRSSHRAEPRALPAACCSPLPLRMQTLPSVLKKKKKKDDFGPVPARRDVIVDWHLAATLERTSYLGGGCVGVQKVHNVTQSF